ncbi:membrane lipoprotein lipid attachment site-containing protein [Bacillus sp. FSL W7-1360]
MKKYLLVLVMAIILSGCGTTSQLNFYDETLSTDLSDENLLGVSLDMSEDILLEKVGKPDFENSVEDPPTTYLIYGSSEDEYEFEFMIDDQNKRVKRYFIRQEGYETARNIEVGSSVTELIAAYGDSYYEREDTGSQVIGFFDKENQVNMEFSTSDNVVLSYIVIDTEMLQKR